MSIKMFCVAVGLLTTIALNGELKVTHNAENVVASRLAGKWVPDAELTERLTGSPPYSMDEVLSFKKKSSVAALFPERFREHFADKPIFMAGTMTLHDQENPFMLAEYNGNPHLFWLRERDGDPVGDGESFNLSLIRAEDRADDLLFIGGDFNNQGFDAYRRKE